MMNFMEENIKNFIGDYGWIFLTTFLMFFFKGAIENMYYGIRFMMGNDYNKDDVIYINKQKCRIVRMGIYRTILYNEDCTRKLTITNSKLQNHIIEKKLLQ